MVKAASPGMRAVENIIPELAQSDVSVLLLGEAGTGKRTVARQIHESSRHTAEKFRILNCAELTEANFREVGSSSCFREGTVFLEEVGNLDASCQTRLMDAFSNLEKGSAAQARLICGSAYDLGEKVRAGRVREDFYYRISGVCLRLPPVRQRQEDILALTEFFLSKFAQDYTRPVPILSPETRRLFQDYSWPGNIPELADAAKALVILGDESLVMRGFRAMLTKPERNGDGAAVSLKEVARAASREAEKQLILKALTRTRWNRRRAAQELKISYKALLYKLKQIGYSESEAS